MSSAGASFRDRCGNTRERLAFPKAAIPQRVCVEAETPMKTLLSIFALALGLALTVPAFAGDVSQAKTQADCEKAGGAWDAQASKCSEKKM